MEDLEPGSRTAVHKAPGLQIVFKDLRYTVQVKEKKKRGLTERHILKDVNGVLQPARLTAVMGASGAGKTTLLNVLAGFTKPGEKVVGSISVNGASVSVEKMRRISGFVHQEDVILHTMTVREALVFSAMLKLPRSMTGAQKTTRALDVARLLNLHKSLESVVGSSMIKGISGGEKRRLSLGMEMVTEPSILFLDEPSSGLDAFNAFKVVHILRSVAHRHMRTVVCTIHQPSSEIFHMFDDLTVLAEGQVIYLGEVEEMVDYFASLGYRCPTYTNPADYLFMEILNAGAMRSETSSDDTTEAIRGGGGDTRAVAATEMGTGAAARVYPEGVARQPTRSATGSSGGSGSYSGARTSGVAAKTSLQLSAAGPDTYPAPAQDPSASSTSAPASAAATAAATEAKREQQAEQDRIAALIAAWRASPHAEQLHRSFSSGELVGSGISKEAESARAPFWVQFLLLAQRAWLNAWRNPLVLKGKLAQTVFLSLVVGLIYLQLSDDQSGVQDRLGSLFFLVVQGLFGSVMGVLGVFGAEKPVFQREFGNRMYGLPAYFISRWAVELPGQILMPILSAVICYWMIGYQNEAAKFGWFALILVLMDTCGAGLGIFVSCIFNDLSVALSVMPMFMLPLMVFSGFFVNSNTIPPYFVWIQYISPMHYGYIALVINEFKGLQINCSAEQQCGSNYNGDTVIRNMGFDDEGSIGQNAGILFAMMWAWLIFAYVALWFAVRRLVK